jgi:hypothetical protein
MRPSYGGCYLGLTVSPRTQDLPDRVSSRANRTFGVSESETTGLFTALMTANGLLISSESVIGERPIGRSKSNHTLRRSLQQHLRTDALGG